jgi:MFS family permease
VATSLASAYDVSLTVVGLFTTALFVTHSAVQIPSGRATDRFGARRVVLASVFTMIAGNALALIAPAPGLALAARAITGVGTGAAFVSASEYVRAAGGSPFAQGIFVGMGVGGGAAVLGFVPQLERAVGWRAPFLLACAIGLAALVALLAGPLPSTAARAVSAGRSTALRLLGDRSLYRVAAMHTASFGLSVIAGNWVVTLLERHGYSTALAGGLGALTLGGSAASRPLGGWIMRHRSAQTRLAVGTSLAAGALGTAGLAGSGPVALAAVSAATVGLAAGIPFAPAFAGAARARPETPGAAIGAINMCGSLMILAATPLVGLTFSLPGSGRIGFVAIAVLWAAALFALPPSRLFR